MALKKQYGPGFRTEILWNWEKPFRENGRGWRGSDCAFSIPLENNRSVWLFGDTFIQQNPDTPGRAGSSIINNSVGIQHGPWKGSETRMTFHWGKNGDRPRSLFINPEKPGFLWALSGAYVQGKLLIFGLRILHENPEKVFGFKTLGSELIIVDNPGNDPEQWMVRYHPFPWNSHKIGWGSTVLLWDKDLYVYGFLKRAKSWRRRLHLVAARIRSVEHLDLGSNPFSGWEFFNASTGRWSGDFRELKSIQTPSTSEFSMHFDRHHQKFFWLLYSRYPGKSVYYRLSETPVGPFSKRMTVFKPPEPSWNRHYFSYAAKIHPELSSSNGDLVFTYITNSRVLWDCIEDERIYFPRFVKLVPEQDQNQGQLS